jgi:hypothetical protein
MISTVLDRRDDDALSAILTNAGDDVVRAASTLISRAYRDGRMHTPIKSQLPTRWATSWASWAGVATRTAQGWINGSRQAPAWAVLIAIENLDVIDKGAAALELLELLSKRRTEKSTDG